MKIIITGGTGFAGSLITQKLAAAGHTITIIDRTIKPTISEDKNISFITADTTIEGPWMDQISSHDAVINLAGANVFQRWTNESKKAIRDSRILTTRNITAAVSKKNSKTKRLINASAVGYYGFTGDNSITESSPAGNDFLARLSAEWESEALKAADAGLDVSLCRFGVILGKGGGALSTMLPVFKMNFGARLGSGKQWFPWIHIEDIAGIIIHLLNNKSITGPVNCAAPGQVTNAMFTKELASALGKKIILPPVPGFALKILFGEVGNVLLEGQKVSPEFIMSKGYKFIYPELKEALKSIL